MKERPIPFKAQQVRALLDGSKTQDRRVVKGEALQWLVRDKFSPAFIADPSNGLCPYGQPGDRLWVRETWRTDARLDEKPPRDFTAWPVRYEANGDIRNCGPFFGDTTGKLRPSMFMPRWASRITLEITGVRVERLQDISEADAMAEGCGMLKPFSDHWQSRDVAKDEYRDLWESINGKGSWALNPWVWVISFNRLEANNGSA